MTHALFRLCAALLLALGATPALAQRHVAPAVVGNAELLSQTSAEAREVFGVGADGRIRHLAAGFACPAQAPGIGLTKIGLGGLPGQTGADAAFCEYSDTEGPVARLTFSRDSAEAPVLSQDFCRGLTAGLGLPMSAGRIPGNARQLGPARQEALPSLPIGGESAPLWRCAHVREPVNVPVIIFDAAAVRAPNGWTILALHTPKGPPCCNAYRGLMDMGFFLMPVVLIDGAADVPDSAFPHDPSDPFAIDRLRPRPDNFPR